MPPISNIICCVFGKTGVGKSTLTNYAINKEYQIKRRGGIVILDHKEDHKNLLKYQDFVRLPITDRIFNNYNLDWKGILKEYPYIIVEPIKLSRDEYEKLADDIAGGLIEVENRVYVIEEAQLAFPVNGSIRRSLSVLVTTGRKIGIDLYFTSQRPAMCNSVAVSQSNIRICFAVDDLVDLKRTSTYFSGVELEKLKRFQFVCKNTMNHKQIVGSTSDLSVVDEVIWGK